MSTLSDVGAKVGSGFKADRARITTVEKGKVDKVVGKQLSTEDYSTAEKSKLAGIEEGAEVNVVTSVASKVGNVTLNKTDVGLNNVDNTADADKPVSTAQQTALNTKVNKVTSTDNAVVRFDGTSGEVQNSSVIIDDIGDLTISSGALRGSYGAGSIASNFAAGNGALQLNTTGVNNTANGANALNSNTTGVNNTANGYRTLQLNTTGVNNTANGASALNSNTTGFSNTANGASALNSNTTFSNISGFGYNAQVTGSNQVQLGDSSTTTYVYGTVQNRSDLRDKADIRDTVLGLDFIKSLRPVDYKWDMREDYKYERPDIEIPIKPNFDEEEPESDVENYDELFAIYTEKKEVYDIELAEYEAKKAEYDSIIAKWLEDNKLENIVRDGSKKRTRYHQGFVAQEVQALGVEFGGIQDHKLKGGDDVLSIGYDEMIAPLVKAVQEQQAMIEELKAEIIAIKGV